MPPLVDPGAWILQAEADLAAAQAKGPGASDCHRRYWYQQSYEKALKAFAVAHLRHQEGDRTLMEAFHRHFFLQHSPLLGFEAKARFDLEEDLKRRHPNDWQRLSRDLTGFQRQLRSFVHNLSRRSTLARIDATRPRPTPDAVSYRYPFWHRDGRRIAAVAPVAFKGWDAYQGTEADVLAAIEELMIKVKLNIAKVNIVSARRRP